MIEDSNNLRQIERYLMSILVGWLTYKLAIFMNKKKYQKLFV